MVDRSSAGAAPAPGVPATALARPPVTLTAVLNANRDVTFGYLLGYLSLALHATLEYTRFTGFFVGPWEEYDVPESDRPARAWRRTVDRRGSYGPEARLGAVTAVISDREEEPLATYRGLGLPEAGAADPYRIRVRTRLPRVDLVVDPSSEDPRGLANFADEIGERFRRNLD